MFLPLFILAVEAKRKNDPSSLRFVQIYRENFERAYLEATDSFYKTKAPQFLSINGVQDYMRYAKEKLKEEEQRATRYLETRKG